jgi:molybdopterin-containing oxidoreductase family membrane subunit
MGSFGLFFTLFLLFCRYLPMVAMAEVKSVLPQANPHNIDGQPNQTGYAPQLTEAEKH